ncbi:MAG TPA: hypothetical protein VHZ25_09240 [Acidobacteriaceae bacterium]|jgi:hypothetical protein|nr:hypothetical protein [Acidobacteriaceae bacterium]
MTDLLLFAESLFFWHLVNYALSTDPIRDNQSHPENAEDAAQSWRPWLVGVGSRSLVAAILVIAVDGFRRTGFLLAGILFAGSVLLPIARRLIPVASLAEFELFANGVAALSLGWTCTHLHAGSGPLRFTRFDATQASAIFICAALFMYAIRGGSYLVRGLLEKAGGIPSPAVLTNEGYTHGRMIGQVERAIVVLIVMGGNLAALAFFFAAKGLIRSRELEERARVDYLLLGSLISFLIALVAGLVLQKTVAILWK